MRAGALAHGRALASSGARTSPCERASVGSLFCVDGKAFFCASRVNPCVQARVFVAWVRGLSSNL